MILSIQELGLILRFAERIAILLISILIIWQGVRLLTKSMEGNSQVEYSGMLGKIKMTNITTGAILILFAIIILAFSLTRAFEHSKSVQTENIITPANNETNTRSDSTSSAKEGNTLSNIERSKQDRNITTKQTTTETTRYADPLFGNYTGKLIKQSTVESLFKKLRQLRENPAKIERSELAELEELYEEIFNFNRDLNRDIGSNFSPQKLRQ